MANKALRFCAHPGCSELVTSGYCEEHKAQKEEEIKEQDRKRDRGRASSAERGYDNKWRKARRAYLHKHPLCVQCQKDGKITPATVVDHIIPHKGDMKLFWDKSNWQSLCKRHHDIKTAKEDKRWG